MLYYYRGGSSKCKKVFIGVIILSLRIVSFSGDERRRDWSLRGTRRGFSHVGHGGRYLKEAELLVKF